MFRHIQALHQINEDNQQNIEFIIESDDINKLKAIFSKYKIITLSTDEFSGDYSNFWQYIIQFDYDWKLYNLVSNTDDIFNFAKNLVYTWMLIKTISKTDWTLSQEESQELLTKINDEITKLKEKEMEEKLKQEQLEEKQFGSATRDKIASIIWQTIADIEDLQQKSQKYPTIFSSRDLKQLEDYKWELMKLKRWTNADKMTQLLEDVFIFMEKLELQYIDFLKEQETKVRPTSNVSDVDVSSEYEKFQRAKKIAQSWAAKSRTDNFYIMFWKLWLFIRFLQKDLFSKTSKLLPVINWFAKFIEYIILFLIIEITIYSLIFWKDQKSMLVYLINVGCLWFAMTATKILKFDNMITTIIWAISSFGLYVFMFNFLSTNFSL